MLPKDWKNVIFISVYKIKIIGVQHEYYRLITLLSVIVKTLASIILHRLN